MFIFILGSAAPPEWTDFLYPYTIGIGHLPIIFRHIEMLCIPKEFDFLSNILLPIVCNQQPSHNTCNPKFSIHFLIKSTRILALLSGTFCRRITIFLLSQSPLVSLICMATSILNPHIKM